VARAGGEIAHLSYKRARLPEAARGWEFDVIAGVIGRAFRLFLEHASPDLVAEGFEQRMRASWPEYLNYPIATGFPSDTNPRSLASESLHDLSRIRPASIEDLLTRPEDATSRSRR
jgi:hypothetical protein